ncbi:MAG: acireductone synthase [Pirellulales bacterium]
MISFGGRCLLLDIEGTTSSVSFVYDKMFPEVRRRLSGFLADGWEDPEVQETCALIARDIGFESSAAWLGTLGPTEAQQCVASEVIRQMDQDLKATGLKALQGLIWRDSFERGELRAHLYEDVLPAIRSWVAAGRQVDIYSSGSVAAQRLFFGHTIHGDLLPMLSYHFDTTIGSKRESDSYRRIASQLGWAPAEILFASDVVAELDAARVAGLQTVLCQRPGNAAVPLDHQHAQITSFAQIELISG